MQRLATAARPQVRSASIAAAACAATIAPRVRHRFPAIRSLASRSQALRAASASTVYGAPFTNSIAFRPLPLSPGDSSALPPAQSWQFVFTVPELAPVELRVHARDSVATISQLVEERLGVPVVLYSNGRRAENGVALVSLFGTAVEFSLDGVHYSVNEGLRLSPQGSVAKRTLLRSYLYLAAGASTIVVGSVLFWNSVVPPGHNRLQQLRRQSRE